MRRASILILSVCVLISLNARVFEAASGPDGQWRFVHEATTLVAQKKKEKKKSKQQPIDTGLPGGVPGGLPGGVHGGVPDSVPDAPRLSQTLPNLVQKGEELEQDATKRVEAVFSGKDKAAYRGDAIEVEVVIDEQGNVIEATALSGHPRADAAVTAARQWKFKPAMRSGKPAKAAGTLTFRVFEGGEAEQTKIWQENLKVYQDQSGKRTPDQKKLAMAMALLSLNAVDADKISETWKLFEEAERRSQLPPEARPYYAKLIEEKYSYDLAQSARDGKDAPSGEHPHTKALALYRHSQEDEMRKSPPDNRLVFDLAVSRANLGTRDGSQDQPPDWPAKLVELPGISDKQKAQVYLFLGAELASQAHAISYPYPPRRQGLSASELAALRPLLQRGHEDVQKALSIEPDYIDAWNYELMLLAIESRTEKNPQKKKAIDAKREALRDQYRARLQDGRSESVIYSSEPYASGLPSLNVSLLLAPPPPPPPPPPPSVAPRRVVRPAPDGVQDSADQTDTSPPPPIFAPRPSTSQKPSKGGVRGGVPGGVPGGQQGARSRRGPPTTPLITAAKQLNLARVKALLAQKANINAKDAEGKTALMHALSIAGGTAAKVIDELLNRGADVNAKDYDGAAALSYAVISSYVSHIQTLIDKGADVNAQESDGYTALMYAAEDGKAEIVRILLDNGANVGLKNDDGDTAMSLAEVEGHTEIVEMLRKASSETRSETRRTSEPKGINEKDDSGETALTRAVNAERLQEVRSLLDRGANPNVKNDDNKTPLLIAVKIDNAEIAQALLDKNADANAKSEYEGTALMLAIKNRNAKIVQALLAKSADPIAKSGFGDTPLEEAEDSGNTEIITAVFNKLPDLNAKNRQGLTPLMRAARAGRKEVVQLLLSKGADPNAKGAMGATALALAFEKKRSEIARTLIAKGAAIDTLALLNAIGSGQTEFVKLALDKGADVNASAIMGVTPLMGAIMESRTEIARMLIDRGANVNAAMAFGIMPLMGAAMEDNPEIVQMLLDKGADVNAKSIMNKTALLGCGAKTVRILLAKGADVNAKDDEGNTALMEATTKGRLEVAQALLEKGVDVNAKDKRGRTALAIAESEGQTRIVQVLLAKGADVNLKDNEGKTVLMIAATNGASDVVQTLIEKRADVNAKDTAGKTPLMHATNKGQTEIVALLKKAGARE